MSVNALNLSTVRLTGLSSGLDTDSIVSSLLQIDQMKVDKQYKATTKLEWKSDALREVNTLIKNFRQENLSVLNSANNMLSTSTYKANTVSMLTDTTAVTISAGATAMAASMSIDSITQLAANAQVKGSAAFSESISTDGELSELPFTNVLAFEGGEISFSINSVEFIFSQEDTLDDVIGEVNSSDAGVTMRYSSLTKGFYISSNTTGSESTVEIVNITGNAFATENSAFGIAQGTTYGQDAVLSIDETEVVESTNTFTVDGITYSLKNTADTPISFAVQRDIEGICEKISNFMDSYNTLITTLQDKVNQETYSDYGPLTETEKDALSESQIEKWETKAKSGLLRNDRNLRSLLGTMRNAFYTVVESAGMSASEIGLRTESYSTTGEIVIDEDALREALEENPDQVVKLFTSTSEATEGSTIYQESGLITRISNALLSHAEINTDVTLGSLTTQIDQAEDKLGDLEEWLVDQEDYYYKKFSAMEEALAILNSTSSWLSTMVSSWSSSDE